MWGHPSAQITHVDHRRQLTTGGWGVLYFWQETMNEKSGDMIPNGVQSGIYLGKISTTKQIFESKTEFRPFPADGGLVTLRLGGTSLTRARQCGAQTGGTTETCCLMLRRSARPFVARINPCLFCSSCNLHTTRSDDAMGGVVYRTLLDVARVP